MPGTRTRKQYHLKKQSRTKTKHHHHTHQSKNSSQRQRQIQSPEFPWYADEYNFNLSRILDIVARRKPQLKIYTTSPARDYPKYHSRFIPFANTKQYYIIKSPWDDNLELNYLTDYFTEKCRMTCQFGRFHSPLEYWRKNHHAIQRQLARNRLPLNNYNVREALYSMNRLMYCNNFRISLCLEVLDLFKPAKWLDISAGWGDRLISALLSPHVEEYCGVDPNPCLHPGYNSIIKHLDPTRGKKCTLIQDGFESAKLPPNAQYDLVFSSPPFFNLEVYSKEATDSITAYASVDAWFSGFLMPAIKKSLEHLAPGGHLVLYIAEAHDEVKYIPRMIEETDKLAANAGRFYYTDGKRIREFYCWQR